jgi:hypothetical protein
MPIKQPEPVDPALLDAFERELTPDSVRRLLEFANRRTAMLRVVGISVAADEAKIFVQDAISDTLTRVAVWQPGNVPLWLHLRGVVRRRSWARLAQARKNRSLSLEQLGDQFGPIANASQTGEQAPPLPDQRRGALEVIHQVINGLTERSADDAAVRLLLDAYCDGATTRAEVIEQSGLSAEDYVNARRRLDRMLAALPEPVRESAFQTMWRLP